MKNIILTLIQLALLSSSVFAKDSTNIKRLNRVLYIDTISKWP